LFALEFVMHEESWPQDRGGLKFTLTLLGTCVCWPRPAARGKGCLFLKVRSYVPVRRGLLLRRPFPTAREGAVEVVG